MMHPLYLSILFAPHLSANALNHTLTLEPHLLDCLTATLAYTVPLDVLAACDLMLANVLTLLWLTRPTRPSSATPRATPDYTNTLFLVPCGLLYLCGFIAAGLALEQLTVTQAATLLILGIPTLIGLVLYCDRANLFPRRYGKNPFDDNAKR